MKYQHLQLLTLQKEISTLTSDLPEILLRLPGQ
jgi:hypothetical protein